jgi:hypothetical protein
MPEQPPIAPRADAALYLFLIGSTVRCLGTTPQLNHRKASARRIGTLVLLRRSRTNPGLFDGITSQNTKPQSKSIVHRKVHERA